MRQSDIFEEFAKIALDKGIIKKASPEDLQKKLEKNPRADSLDTSAIEALYGVKPDLPKDMKYTRNIIDDAHPDSVVVSPAHDKLNGLVENVNERQDIILNIVNKTPNGHLTQHKYAQQELILSLVRLGNHLDNTGKDKLRVLADACLQQTSDEIKKKDQFKKEAVWGVVGIVAGIAATIGALYAQQHLPFINDGFQKNHDKLIAEIDDMLKDSALVYGQEYTKSFTELLLNFKNKLLEFHKTYQQTEPIIEDIERPNTAQELIQIVKQPQSTIVQNAYDLLRQQVENMLPYLRTISRNFSSEAYKIRQIEDKGWLQKAIDYTRFLHGGKGMFADDFDDVVRGIPPYIESISNILSTFKEAETLRNNAQKQLTQAASTSQQQFGSNPGGNLSAEPTTVHQNPTMFAAQPKQPWEQDAAELDKI